MNGKILRGIGVLILILGGIWYYHESGKGSYTINTELEERYPALREEQYTTKMLNISKTEEIFTKSQAPLTEVVCNSTNSTPTQILYEQRKAPRGYIGGWYSVTVIDCQKEYYISYFGDSGPKLYGPF